MGNLGTYVLNGAITTGTGAPPEVLDSQAFPQSSELLPLLGSDRTAT